MFDAEQKRHQTLASSFLRVEVPAKTEGLPLQVYLTAGDLERAFDSPQFPATRSDCTDEHGSAKSAEKAYRSYAGQIAVALRKGLAGEKTTASDVYGSCNATFNPQ